MDNVKFYTINTPIPEFKASYNGCFVLDSNNDFYLGLEDKWLHLLDNTDVEITKISTVSSTSTALATAYDIKAYVDSKLNSTDSYVLNIDDNGIVSCVKNGDDEGFQIDENGIVSLI